MVVFCVCITAVRVQFPISPYVYKYCYSYNIIIFEYINSLDSSTGRAQK